MAESQPTVRHWRGLTEVSDTGVPVRFETRRLKPLGSNAPAQGDTPPLLANVPVVASEAPVRQPVAGGRADGFARIGRTWRRDGDLSKAADQSK